MNNPFEYMLGDPLENPGGEEVGGSFACQEDDCYNVVTTAIYLDEPGLLTWKCQDEHISKIDYRMDG